jgi:flagellar M-ring protein FliF
VEQFKQLLARLTFVQKVSILAAALAVALSLAWGVRWNKERDLKPLFSGLSAEDAGGVVEKLKAANVEYKVGENGAVILVPSARVAELRLDMAAAGLPKTGRLGFELFDKTNFGATEFSEHVNFRRALEGELERSVMALAEVERARVHVTFAKDSVFLESRQPAKASVLVKLRPGAVLSQQNVLAITHLTASAVEGLAPESVSVLDMNGNLLSKLRKPLGENDGTYSDAMIEYRQAVEKDLLTKIHSTLDPLLGAEKFRTGVSADCDFTSGEQSEENFDPTRSVMVSSQKTEDTSTSASSSGVPGTASNLPRPTSRPGMGGGGVARRTESIAYQTSRTVKHVKIPQGSVKRISISVLVDQSLRWEGAGPKAKRVLEPPSPERLKIVRDMVAGVVGFQQERGDQILVETLPFDATLNAAPPEQAPSASPAPKAEPAPGMPAWMGRLVKIAPLPVWIGIVVALLAAVAGAAFFLIRRRKAKRVVEMQPTLPNLPPGVQTPLIEPGESPEEFEIRAMAQIAGAAAERHRQEAELLADLSAVPTTKKSEILKKHLSAEAKRNPEATAQLVRTWLTDVQK